MENKDDKKHLPVAKGRKVSAASKDSFFKEDMKSISGFITKDIVIPAVKKTLFDVIVGSASMSLFGENRAGRMNNNYGGHSAYRDYSSMNNRNGSNQQPQRRSNRSFDRVSVAFDEFGEAQDVIFNMQNQIQDYGKASIADLYDFSDIAPEQQHWDYGWYAMERDMYSIEPSGNGYILTVFNAVPLR